MSNELVCPVCDERYRDEDYCPVHGVRLVAPAAPAEPGPAPATVANEGAPPPASEREGRLAAFMSRLGLRQAATKGGEVAPAAPSPQPEAGYSPLPEDATKMGWTLAGPVQSSAALDVWPVQLETSTGRVAGHYRRYRTGALTSAATYRHLLTTASPCLARVWAHGTVAFADARADFDLSSLSTPAITLDRWFADSQPSEQRALALLPPLTRLLERLSKVGLAPMLLEPSHLARGEDGELCLVFAGALAESDESPNLVRYHPEFARSALLPHTWAAPELVQQTVLSRNAGVFSAGQLLAHAVWGQPCSHADLQAGAVPFQTLADSRLARVLMGCLWPRSSGRWSNGDLATAAAGAQADCLPEVSPWASLAPGSASKAFAFAGQSWWRLEDLLTRAVDPTCWREATRNIEAILGWAGDTAWAGQAGVLRDALAAGRSSDWVLVALVRAVRPETPLIWRDLDLGDAEAEQSLIRLAQGTLQGNVTDTETVRDLFQADLRGAFAPLNPPSP